MADAGGHVPAPIARIAYVGDVAAHRQAGQLVGARPHWGLRNDLVKRLAAAPALAKNRHAAHDQRQLRIRGGEVKAHDPIGHRYGCLDLCVDRPVLRRSQLAGELRERVNHVSGEYRRCVMKTSLLADPKAR